MSWSPLFSAHTVYTAGIIHPCFFVFALIMNVSAQLHPLRLDIRGCAALLIRLLLLTPTKLQKFVIWVYTLQECMTLFFQFSWSRILVTCRIYWLMFVIIAYSWKRGDIHCRIISMPRVHCSNFSASDKTKPWKRVSLSSSQPYRDY